MENLEHDGVHELYQLASLIDQALLEQEFGALYSEDGRTDERSS